MNYKGLLQGARLFKLKERRARFYDDYVREKDWKEWESTPFISDGEIEKLFGFIKKWDFHFRVDQDNIVKFREVYSLVYPLLKELRTETIHEVDFEKKMGRQSLVTCSQVIFIIFEEIAHSFPRYESTDTSKIIHTIHPDLFVMWDDSICYNVLKISKMKTATGYDYAYRFMPLMKKEINEAIETYMKDHDCSRKEAIENLSKSQGNKTLAKLIDEYNYARFTRRWL